MYKKHTNVLFNSQTIFSNNLPFATTKLNKINDLPFGTFRAQCF